MANSFKRAVSAAVGTGETTLLTVPGGASVTVIGAKVGNQLNNQVTFTLKIAGMSIFKNTPIPANGAFSILDGKDVLEAGDTVTIQASEAGAVDVIVSYLEQS